MTALVVCAHGTDDPRGRAVVDDLIVQVGLLTGTEVHRAFVDVQEPALDGVVAAIRGPAVIVPLLVARGFHTEVDIAGAAGSRPGIMRTRPLAPHPLIAQVIARRLHAVIDRWRPGDHVVLAAAGSRRAEAIEDVRALAALVRESVPAVVTVGFVAAAEPRLAPAVASARAAGARRVIVGSALLAPGFFSSIVDRSGADLITAPLGADPLVAAVIAQRYRAALEGRVG